MTDQEIVALFDDKIGPPAFEFADKRIVAFANALLRKKEEEIVELHARLAGANLRADIGWSRYEAANTARNNAELALSRAIPEGHVVVPGWQPIESAPHDEEILICWENKEESGITAVVKSDHEYWPLGIYGHDWKIAWEDPGTEITHWMLLPAAPANKEG